MTKPMIIRNNTSGMRRLLKRLENRCAAKMSKPTMAIASPVFPDEDPFPMVAEMIFPGFADGGLPHFIKDFWFNPTLLLWAIPLILLGIIMGGIHGECIPLWHFGS